MKEENCIQQCPESSFDRAFFFFRFREIRAEVVMICGPPGVIGLEPAQLSRRDCIPA